MAKNSYDTIYLELFSADDQSGCRDLFRRVRYSTEIPVAVPRLNRRREPAASCMGGCEQESKSQRISSGMPIGATVATLFVILPSRLRAYS